MNNEFKVGDRVKGYVRGKQYHGVVVEVNSGYTRTSYLCRFEGLKGHDGFNDTHSGKPYKTDDHWYCNSINLLEHDDTYSWKVVIIPDGDKTIGKLIENGKTVKEVTTKKHPDDEYDMNYAIKVVTERLTEPKYYNGKVVCIKNSAGNIDNYTVGRIYEIVDGVMIANNGYKITGWGDKAFKSFDEFVDFSSSEFIEVVE